MAVSKVGAAEFDYSPFDREVETFMKERSVPGGALAVSRGGKLVYAKGYGLADRLKKAPVTNETLFRIASISKPVTGVAVMKLIVDGKLKLEDRVLPFIEPLSEGGFPKQMDARWKDVTVAHLLHHTGGWDRDAAFDPMFRSTKIAREMKEKAPASAATVIRYMLRQPLQFDPGSKYSYSNFGYCLLGRIIERVTGARYEEWTKEQILKPMGITSMQIGRSRFPNRVKGETRYYMANDSRATSVFPGVTAKVAWPYGGFHLEAMDSHGGWIATATDLVRFADGLNRTEQIGLFSRRDAMRLYQPPPAPVSRKGGKLNAYYYGCGWMVRPSTRKGGRPNLWHGGSLPGTSSLLVRVRNGVTWAVLFNQRSKTDGAIDPALHRASQATFG